MRRSILLPALFVASGLGAYAQDIRGRGDLAAVTFIKDRKVQPDEGWQSELRGRSVWRQFVAQHPGWWVEFNEANGLPHRALGTPISTTGTTPSERALNFLTQDLAAFNLPMQELDVRHVSSTAKHHYVHITQRHEGRDVLFSKALVKLDMQGRVIAFGLDVYAEIGTLSTPIATEAQMISAASAGLSDITGGTVVGAERILPVPVIHGVEHHLVREVEVTTNTRSMPGRWMCYVDAVSGKLLYRQNRILSEVDLAEGQDVGADVTMQATVQLTNPLNAPTVGVLRNLNMTVGNQDFVTDANGFVSSGITGPVALSTELSGLWSTVVNGSTTPSLTGTLQEGANVVLFDPESSLEERSAYYHVNNIHDHATTVLPGFSGMDFSLLTNVDLTTGDCNAFYDGSSINFYLEGNDCYSLARVNDVVYHEYGHGINDNYYQANGGNFINGAMGEGYADFWGFSLTQNPVLAPGYTISDPNAYIRRYDQNRKVYPADITGEVHADGEIIAGAWWDTYVLLGNDMQLTTDLFALAYPGLQAEAAGGNEGVAFRDVLIDVLQADDDDGNLLNGTPHGDAIGEGFRLHGITLLTGFDVVHTPVETAPVNDDILIQANASVTGVFQNYLQGVQLSYRVNQGVWQQMMMTNTGGSNYEATIPGQPLGTVISYYIGLLDVSSVISGVTPSGAADPDPNLPNYMLIGFDLKLTENADNLNELGDWDLGVAGDNNTTGTWELYDPNPTYSTVDNSIIQTGDQHTPGGEFCFFTGNGTDPTTPGEADVDAGFTTLRGDPIDLTSYINPTFTYYRWYTNSPPGGANPGADWWQVQITNNGTDWVYVENTKSDDRAWRRVAFRVQDFVVPNSTVQLRFIASDSTRLGQNLDGGSLVEGAMDDLQLWDNTVVGIDEQTATINALYPDPADATLNIVLDVSAQGRVMAEVLDPAGRIVLTQPLGNGGGMIRSMLDVRGLMAGGYVLRARWDGGSVQQRFSVVR